MTTELRWHIDEAISALADASAALGHIIPDQQWRARGDLSDAQMAEHSSRRAQLSIQNIQSLLLQTIAQQGSAVLPHNPDAPLGIRAPWPTIDHLPDSELVAIYALSDPRDGKIRYVGKTTSALNVRLYGHVVAAKSGKTSPKDHWIRMLLAEGIEPTIQLLEAKKYPPAMTQVERWWIEYQLALGADLLNVLMVPRSLDTVTRPE